MHIIIGNLVKIIALLKESNKKETRTAITADTANALFKKNITVYFENTYEENNDIFNSFLLAKAIPKKRDEILKEADIIVGVDECMKLDCKDKILIGFFDPFFNKEAVLSLCKNNNTVIPWELIPRISRAQSMDALSSQANIAGYQSVIWGLSKSNKMMPMLMTAAGTIKPAKVLVLGAGVAGLSAIATAKRLGAVVYGYDVRTEAKEQIQSFGAKNVELAKAQNAESEGGYAKALSNEEQQNQRMQLTDFAKDMDLIITTAQIQGRAAPKLLDSSIFEKARSGTVIVDLASKTGGNVDGSKLDEWQQVRDVFIYGGDNLARVPYKDASFTLSKNFEAIFNLIEKDPFLKDEIFASALACKDMSIVNQRLKQIIEA